MTTLTIEKLRKQIDKADKISMEAAKARWMSVAKPLFSLGKLEDVVVRMAGMKKTAEYQLDKKGLIIMCADNGVVAEGVTQTGQEVTAIVADNFMHHAASTNIMADIAGVDLIPVDIGMITDVSSITVSEKKVRYGTKNFAVEPAMSREEVWKAIQIGIDTVKECKQKGYDILATGEMGIGNTTTSSAVTAILLQKPVEKVTGKGAGLSSVGLQRKIITIETAINKYKPDSQNIIEVLACVGGLDIAGLTGVCLGGAMYHVPIVLDGFISTTAALCAVKMIPETRDYIIASHVSNEPAGRMLLNELKLSPFLDCNMCLGEGSGAVAAMPLLDMGLQVYRQMGTFSDIKVEQYEVLE